MDLKVRLASPSQRRRFLLDLYIFLQQRDQRVGYSDVQAIVRKIAPLLRAKGIDLGYRFESENFYGPWDRLLHHDMKILDMTGRAANDDYRPPNAPESLGHKIKPTAHAEKYAQIQDRLAKADYLWGLSRAEIRTTVLDILDSRS